MKLINIETYDAKVYTFRDEGEKLYHVVKQDSFLNNIYPEYRFIGSNQSEMMEEKAINNMNIEKYTIEELIQLKDDVTSRINSYEDGYLYICNVRSYVRNWRERWIYNTHTLQELCHQYFGEDGIVDVYSTNPDLNHLENYGDVMYIVSEEDYNKWEKYVHIKNSIPRIEEELVKWDNRDDVPSLHRYILVRTFWESSLDDYKKQLEDCDMSFTPPIRYSDKK